MNSSLSTVAATVLARLDETLEPGSVLLHFDPSSPYCHDWSGDYQGMPIAVLRPRTTEDAAIMVRQCSEAGLRLIPYGGHTGLVGGATPIRNGQEILLSLERMNRVPEIDPLNFSMVVEAGCILANVQQAALDRDLLFPLSFGAAGSCQIGGAIATNAGGVNVLRYGMARDLVLGLEVVLPDGRIWNGLKMLRKDNTGYDLKQLFVGAEGTLGVITAAALRLFPRPTQTETAFLAVDSVGTAMALYAWSRRGLSDLLSAFELIPHVGVELAMEAIPGLRRPLETHTPYYILLEASASGLVNLKELVERFLESLLEHEGVLDGVLTSSLAQANALWRIREGMVEGQVRRGKHLRTDVSVKISQLAAFIDAMDARLHAFSPGALPLAYGHVGDGNVHFNVLPPEGMTDVDAWLHQCEEIIFSVVDAFDGSISAEHGIGRKRREAFRSRASAVQLDMLERIKGAFDPQRVMSPGRIFDAP